MEKTGFQEFHNRKAAFAGKFYPATKEALTRQMEDLFTGVAGNPGIKTPRAIIAPHAGYVFSGRVAASAFNQIPERAKYKRIFVLASSHQFFFEGASVYAEGNYETPMGELKVDTDLAVKLTESNNIFRRYSEAHEYEHSLEVELPFLQYKLENDFILVPVIIGTNKPADCEKIAKALEPWFTPENLFVISTDFSHYPEYDDAVKNDLVTAMAICTNNPDEFLKVLDNNKKKKINHLATSLCGWTSVLTLLFLTRGKNLEFKRVEYKNSGDAEFYGDKERVVGYWAIAVFDGEELFVLSIEEQQELIEKARDAIVSFFETGKRGKPLPPLTDGILKKKSGVFVSVYVNGELRGCVGDFVKELTLNELTQQMAVSAACDFRFEHLKKDELGNMKLEISILSPLKRIHSKDEIQLGKHGIYIKKGLNSGTFLPQVALKAGWSLDEFLGRCSRDKAGLGWNGWKNAELFVYEAFVFRG